MKTVCAWCNTDLGDKEPLKDTRVSHGICVTCHKQEMEKVKMRHYKVRVSLLFEETVLAHDQGQAEEIVTELACSGQVNSIDCKVISSQEDSK